LTHAEPAQPNYLMTFIIGILEPLLMTGGLVDARLAATQAIAAYNANTQTELVTIGQILAFALTALDNLSLSAAPGLSLSMKLKLRGGANALNRSARDNTKLLDKSRRDNVPLEPSIAEQAAMSSDHTPADHTPAGETAAAAREEPETAAREETGTAAAAWATTKIAPDPAPARQPDTNPQATPEHQNQLHWASGMKNEAARLQSKSNTANPAQRKADRLWISVLTTVATNLTQGNVPTASPGVTKSDLFRSTLLSSGATFPAHLGTRRHAGN
jgi:hypothetical protein